MRIPNTQPLRVAVIGSGRGRTFVKSAEAMKDLNVELAAICDSNEAQLEKWRESHPGLKLYPRYEQVLEDGDIDIVCVATPVELHADQSVRALNAGKHVICEVPAVRSVEEGLALIEAVERSGKTYMMAENYCYAESVMQVQHMVELGVFGEITYASGSYIHDCRGLLFDKDSGDLTWRGRGRQNKDKIPVRNSYPTHSVGPVARWLGINRTDFFDTTATWQSRMGAVPYFAAKNYPDRKEYADPSFWHHADSVSTVIRTEKGVLIDLRFDSLSARPHNMSRFELQGIKAAFCQPDGMKKEPLIWIEGRSPAHPNGTPKEWEPLFKYRDEFQHPLWREFGEAAANTGHGGGDFFVLREFVSAVREGRQPAINVYDAVTWSSIIELSMHSVAGGNIPVKVPRFQPTQK